jgi:hypothetical protein
MYPNLFTASKFAEWKLRSAKYAPMALFSRAAVRDTSWNCLRATLAIERERGAHERLDRVTLGFDPNSISIDRVDDASNEVRLSILVPDRDARPE